MSMPLYHFKGSRYHHDLSLAILTLVTWLREVCHFSTIKLVFFTFLPSSQETSIKYSQFSKRGELRSPPSGGGHITSTIQNSSVRKFVPFFPIHFLFSHLLVSVQSYGYLFWSLDYSPTISLFSLLSLMHIKYQEEGQIYKFSIIIISNTRIRENRRTQRIPQKGGRSGNQLT